MSQHRMDGPPSDARERNPLVRPMESGDDKEDPPKADGRFQFDRSVVVERALDFLEAGTEGGYGQPGMPERDPEREGLAGRLFTFWTLVSRYSATAGGWFALGAVPFTLLRHEFGFPLIEGSALGAPPASLSAMVITALLGTSMLLLREKNEDLKPARKWGERLAALATAISAVMLIILLLEPSSLAWEPGGVWGAPQAASLIIMALLGAGLATLDLDHPRHRWFGWLLPLTGFTLLLLLVHYGYEIDAVVSSDSTIGLSLLPSAVLTSLYLGLAFLRPGRGLARMLLDRGPGSAATRILIPTVLVLTALVSVLGFAIRDVEGSLANLGNGSTEITIFLVLLLMTYFLSRLLQRHYLRGEEALADLVDRAAILDNLAEGVAVIELGGGEVLLANHRLEELLGHGRGELVGRAFESFVPPGVSPAEAERWADAAYQLVEAGASIAELPFARQDHSILWGRSASVFSQSARFGPVVVWSLSDITDEYRNRATRERSERRFRRVFDRSPIGLSTVRADHSFESVNPAFLNITGYSESELLQMTFDEITHPDDLARDRELSLGMFGGDRDGFELEKRYIRKDGAVVWVRLSTVMLDSEEDEGVALSMAEDVTTRRELTAELEHMANHDSLTGLLNRRRLGNELRQAVSSKSVQGKGIAVLVLDLDNFKFINDRYGHSTGDQLIVSVARLLENRLRAGDTLARQGGDEFVVILREIEQHSALRVAGDIAELIAADHSVRLEGVPVRVTTSIGVAFSAADETISEEELLAQADIAMYEAKDEGRNIVKLFDPDEETSIASGIGWTGRIAAAVENDGFVAVAQPIVRLSGDEPTMFEMFVRMKGEGGSLIAPGSFLPVAEKYDLILGVDRWMLERAIRLLEEHQRTGVRVRLCVNLSGRSFGDLDLLETISSHVGRTGVDPALLVFEVTETGAIRNMASARSFASALVRLGCGVALDDFGTGLASLSYVKAIECDYLKIDGEFVRGLVGSEIDQLMVKAVVDIARGLGKSTVAEMVEDEQTLAVLASLGVDWAQGYLIARPEPVEAIDFASPDFSREHLLANLLDRGPAGPLS